MGEEGESSETDSKQNKGDTYLGVVSKGAARNALLFVDLKVRDSQVKALLDTGATHNFVADRVVSKLGLALSKSPTTVKAVNSSACGVTGIAYNVKVCVGCWTGKINLTAVPLDDFDVILGIYFF
ncbi:hypothetical protein Patl1_36808 [Pistacia atlantica]|nr:hypothetical protein Patl1_36808 [Pistacia atlantica]